MSDFKLLSRRKFLTKAGSALIATSIASLATTAKTSSQESQQLGVKEWCMVIDLRRCIGCQACFAACKSENGVPLGIEYTWVETHEKGKYPNIKLLFLPRLCNHCDKPPCVQVCPVKATWKREDGVVMQDINKCIGCRYCMAACPYGVRSFTWEEPSGAWFEPWMEKATAKHGFVVKCHGCYHRVEKGLKPACVEACVGGARIFGDFKDPNSEVRKLIDSLSTTRLKAYLGTEPMVFYIGLDEKVAELGRKAPGAIIVHEEEEEEEE
jgi:tetrathionate reductase subunit B